MTTKTTRTITLTNRPPVKIVEDNWDLIASSTWFEGEYDFQATRSGWLKVRQHADGRTLVYGGYDTAWQHESTLRGGELLTADADIAGAINRVAATVKAEECAAACIADLPAEEI